MLTQRLRACMAALPELEPVMCGAPSVFVLIVGAPVSQVPVGSLNRCNVRSLPQVRV